MYNGIPAFLWKRTFWLIVVGTTLSLLFLAYWTGFLAFLHYAFFPGKEWYMFSRQTDPSNSNAVLMDGVVWKVNNSRIRLWSAKGISIFTIPPETTIYFSILKRKGDKWLATKRLQDLVSKGVLVKTGLAPIQGIVVVGDLKEERRPFTLGETYLLSEAAFDPQNLLNLLRAGDIVQLQLDGYDSLKAIMVKKLTYGL